ncbi:MAG: nitrite reductase small subunit NirD [Acidobacteriia bacterium]|nr:nitrite reductase small subunit NirD [Terriglobia bacterium]
MKTHKWIRITSCDNIPLREGRAVNVGGLDIAVFNLGGRFLAVDNRCPHNGGPLADGIVSGTTVVCPLHAWRVDLECGAVTKPADTAACLRTFRTRVEEGVVLLEVSALQASVKEMCVEEEIACRPAAATVAVLRPNIEPTDRV